MYILFEITVVSTSHYLSNLLAFEGLKNFQERGSTLELVKKKVQFSEQAALPGLGAGPTCM